MKSRTTIINELIFNNNYQSYLEIGLGNGKNFESISCELKCGVDPILPTIFNMKNAILHDLSSDVYFSNRNEKYDLVFIDGLHHAEQVEKDIINGWNSLNKNGMLLLHDCNPFSELMQKVPRIQAEWTGDVWRACVGFKSVYNKRIKTSLILEPYGIFAIYKSECKIESGFVDWGTTYDEFAQNRFCYLGHFEID